MDGAQPGKLRLFHFSLFILSFSSKTKKQQQEVTRRLTCRIFFPSMEALVSMTNTTFLGTAGRLLGAK